MVRGIAARMTGDTHLAFDLAQEALLQAFLSLDSLREDRRFKSWLYGITLNVYRVYARSHKHAYSLDDMLGGIHMQPGPTPEEIAEHLELRRMVMDAINVLSPANRAAVLLFYYEGFSMRDTAEALEISVTALKGRLHKARRQLAASLSTIDKVENSYVPTGYEGGKRMIPIKIVDVMRHQLKQEDNNTANPFVLVVLFDEAGRRALVIWVGEFEGMAIAQGLGAFETPRPMTALFMSRLLKASGAVLEAVEISALKNDTFYATVRVRVGEHKQEVDARPSDALALALQFGAPIYVAEEVLLTTGQVIPAGQVPSGKGLADIRIYMNGKRQEDDTRRAEQTAKAPELLAQEMQEARATILASAFV
jgi:RNA polymerase sigma factor (sigma-70 family)